MSAARQPRPAPASDCRCWCHHGGPGHPVACCRECIDCGRMTALERCYSCAKRNPDARGIPWRTWWARHGHTWGPPPATVVAPQKLTFGGIRKT